MGNAGNKEDLYSAINSDNTAETTKLLKVIQSSANNVRKILHGLTSL
jgi:hypothetical protein